MRSEVTVDGVRLTREQVERALKELNKPEVITRPFGPFGTEAAVVRSSFAVSQYYLPFTVKAMENIQEQLRLGHLSGISLTRERGGKWTQGGVGGYLFNTNDKIQDEKLAGCEIVKGHLEFIEEK